MQGIKPFIPTAKKVAYLQSLLRVGFDSIDFGSFVSPKAIPQMQDTAEVLAALDLSQTQSKLLAIIANKQGAQAAATKRAAEDAAAYRDTIEKVTDETLSDDPADAIRRRMRERAKR